MPTCLLPDPKTWIETTVKDGTLTIGIGGTWWDKLGMAINDVLSGHKIVYQLTVRELRGVTVSGAGRVKCAELHTDHLAVRVAGAGEVTIGALTTQQLGVDAHMILPAQTDVVERQFAKFSHGMRFPCADYIIIGMILL